AVLASGGVAYATDGQPAPWQIGFQRANTPIMDQITWFHTYVTIIITLIALFVLGLLIYVMRRFNENTNPLPSRTSHNTPIEVAWTVIPILILVAIAIPSFRLLFAQYDFPKPDLTITATGSQWYWTYDYPDHGIHFDSIIVQDADLKQDQPRLLSVDHEVVVPVGKNIQVQVKANDVIHDWAVPSFGIKLEAVRTQPRIHADRRARRVRAGVQRLAGQDQGRQRITGRGRQSGRGAELASNARATNDLRDRRD